MSKTLAQWVGKRAQAIWTNLFLNHLWQRMFKITLATTITVIIALIPAVVDVYGPAAYLGPITTVFGHPGRRFGMMAEALVLTVAGTLLGVGWSVLGTYLSSFVYESNAPAAYAIKGAFLAVALLLHGFLRSHTPRLFIFVLLLIIVCMVSLSGTSTAVSSASATVVLYPILTAVSVLLWVNMFVFPEFSSSFLGITTIETLEETVGTLRDAGKYFISMVEDTGTVVAKREETPEEKIGTAAEGPLRAKIATQPSSLIQKAVRFFSREKGAFEKTAGPQAVKLKTLTDAKSKLRAKLAGCMAAQQECNFELALAVLPPRDLKPISDTNMNKLVANTIALIGACESKYALMGDEYDKSENETNEEHQLHSLAKAAGVDCADDSSRPGTGFDSSHDESSDEKRGENKLRSKEQKRKPGERIKTRLQRELAQLEMIKPHKEIESGDIKLLKYLVGRITEPLAELQTAIDESANAVSSCLAFCYDVHKLPSGARPPRGIRLEEIDIRVDILIRAMADFDRNSASALETAAYLHDMGHTQVDIMPRTEIFLVSSFLLNLRQAALHTLQMLHHSRLLVEKRQARHGRSRLYVPSINWRKWLVSGGEDEPFALPENARKDARTGKLRNDSQNDEESITSQGTLGNRKDVESAHKHSPSWSPESDPTSREASKHRSQKRGLMHRLRNCLADILEYFAGSEDVLYAVKLTVAVFLVTWPAFLYKWNRWYHLNRGLWAAIQLVLVTEVAIGTSVWIFMLRAVGTTLGCIWGYAAFQAHNGNRVVCVALLVLGIIPSAYVQLGTKYVKAGMVSIISMCVVALATVDNTVPGTASENFLRRVIAFLIGGGVALVVEVLLFPVRARDRLVESLAASVHQIGEMEACIAYGVETEVNIDVQSAEVSARFDRARGKAQGALTAAETFLPFCAQEPRLKGSFKGLALIYAEILYVLHAIVDRMDNMLHLRQEYGSGVLEEMNEKVYPYRRNVAASITIVLFAIHEALTTKLPLPQFLPSARLAHLRMVNRVREVVLADEVRHINPDRSEVEMTMVKRVVHQKFISWNAASAGQIEVIEYLEELIDLVKLLVGANEFRSGLLTRPNYRGSVDRMHTGPLDGGVDTEYGVSRTVEDTEDEGGEWDRMPEPAEERVAEFIRRRTKFTRNQAEELSEAERAGKEELPRSLQRVRSRRIEELQLQRTESRDKKGKRSVGKEAWD
ncbi:hypothetical protein QTJ16_001442 [Diplocarpon rosae]|uniref:ER transporter 6TM N-terminal domain-containing protein n=1 Tax=Diplocarpon rosae TaxID=946125 RepID=A0AAD9T7X3_9HELO|nr:hypothetical protein QTJ16_001442 [Diplocarpon rosae]PBP22333.1 hypothetical protein BUE80_DR006891 [Diplocarpon rosae]